MKILLLSPNSGLLGTKSSAYHGGGWIYSLQRQLGNVPDVEVALAFVTNKSMQPIVENGYKYYPIHESPMSPLAKIGYYHGGYKKHDFDRLNDSIKDVVADYQPDIIYLFGLENKLSSVLRCDINVPVLVHLQGLMGPCANAFFPPEMNEHTFMYPVTKREWITKNGYVFAKRTFETKARNEMSLVKYLHYAAGRTAWDRNYTRLYAPEAKYFHIDEILRDTFYDNASTWSVPSSARYVITSTLSDAVYKGLDLVLKTAKVLTDIDFDFEWHIAGINSTKKIVRIFERTLGIDSAKVNIVYDGVRTPDQLVEMINKTNVFVHPSYIDNSPNSLCEAQLVGCPVIGTYVGGVPSLIDNGITGILTQPNDPWSLAGHIQNICTDPNLARNLSANGSCAAAKRHDKAAILAAFLKACDSVIGLKQ